MNFNVVIQLTTFLFYSCQTHFLYHPEVSSQQICAGDSGCNSKCRFENPGHVPACSLTDVDARQCYQEGNFTIKVQIKKELETVLNVMIMNNEQEDLVISITNHYVAIFYLWNLDNTQTPLTKVRGRFTSVSLVLSNMITVRLDNNLPIILDENTRFKTVASVESLLDEAVVFYKSTILQNDSAECGCSEEYPVPYLHRCFTWNMTASVSSQVTPQVSNVYYKLRIPATFTVKAVFYTTDQTPGYLHQLIINRVIQSNLTFLRSNDYYAPLSRLSVLLEKENVSQLDIIGDQSSSLTNVKVLASCGCVECNLLSNFTACNTELCTELGTCTKPATQHPDSIPITLTAPHSRTETETTRETTRESTETTGETNRSVTLAPTKEVLTTPPKTNVSSAAPDIKTTNDVKTSLITEAPVRDKTTQAWSGKTELTEKPTNGTDHGNEKYTSASDPSDGRNGNHGNITVAPTESGNATIASTEIGNVTFAPTESGNATIAPTESGNATIAPTESGNVTFAPTESGNATIASTESRNVTFAPTENGNATIAPTESGNATIAPTESGNVTFAPTESENATIAPTESGNVTFLSTDSGNVTIGPTGSGNVTIAPTGSEKVTIAPTESGNVTVTPTESGNATIVPTANGNMTFATTESENATIAPTANENMTVATTDSGDATFAPTESGNVTVTPTESGNVTIAPTANGNVTTESGNVTTESGNVATESGNVATESGNVTTESGNVATESGNVATESGNVATESGNVTTESGNVTTESGSVTTKSGNVITESGNVTNESGNETTESGNVTTESGNLATESGNVTTESGNVATESGNVTTESGNVATESGNVATESGNVATESGNVATESRNVTTESGNVTTESGNVTTESGNVATESGNVATESGSGTLINTTVVQTRNISTTDAPTDIVKAITEAAVSNDTFYTGLEDFTVDSREEGDVYTRLVDTNLTLLIRLKDTPTRRKRSDDSSLRNFRTLFRTSCELNNCTQMNKVDVLKFRQLDEQTIEHTDTLQSYTAYIYTFVTVDVKISKEIVTSPKEPEVVDTVKSAVVSDHQIQVDWRGVFRANSRVLTPGCFVVSVTAANVTTIFKTDLTRLIIGDHNENSNLEARPVIGLGLNKDVPGEIKHTDIVVKITLKTDMGNVTATSHLPAAQQKIARSVLILSIVFGVLGTLLLVLIFAYIIYRIRRNAAHSYHFNPNTMRQEYRPSEAERSKMTFNTNQSQSTIHHNRMCAQPNDPKEEGNTVFKVKRVNATENLLAECHVTATPSRHVTATPTAPAHTCNVSHVTPAVASLLRYERTQSESSATGSITHCQTEIRDKAVTLTSQDGTSQTYL